VLLLLKGEKGTKQPQPVWNDFELGQVKNIIARKRGKRACTMIIILSIQKPKNIPNCTKNEGGDVIQS